MRLHRPLLALAAGFVLTFAYPKWEVEWLVWVWILPLMFALWSDEGPESKAQDLRGSPQKRSRFPFLTYPLSLLAYPFSLLPKTSRNGFKLGYFAGMAFFVPNLAWLRHSSRVIGGALGDEWMGWGTELMGMVAVLLMAGYLSIYFGLWAAFAATVGRPRISVEGKAIAGDSGKLFSVSLESLRSASLNAAAWVACEWLRGIVFTGFGWNGLGVALHEDVALIQVVDIVGVSGLSFLPVFAAGVGYNTVLRFRQEVRTSRVRPHLDFFCAVSLILACYAYGGWRLTKTQGETVSLRTLLVQENIPQAVKWGGEKTTEIYHGLANLTRPFVNPALINKAELVIWPESALPLPLDDDRHLGFLNEVLAMGDFSLLTGVDIIRPEEPGYTGAALLRGNFANQQVYRKVCLVPYGEYLPLRFVPGMEWLLGGVLPGDFAPGTSTEPLSLNKASSIQLIPLVCFEDTFGRHARKFVREAPQLLVNCTNDGWFLQSEENEQHLANALFRCVELHRPMARACNTGVTCFIDEFGRIGKGDVLRDGKTGSVFIRGSLPKEVKLAKQPIMTFYAQYGDLFSISMLALVLLVISLKECRTQKN